MPIAKKWARIIKGLKIRLVVKIRRLIRNTAGARATNMTIVFAGFLMCGKTNFEEAIIRIARIENICMMVVSDMALCKIRIAPKPRIKKYARLAESFRYDIFVYLL